MLMSIKWMSSLHAAVIRRGHSLSIWAATRSPDPFLVQTPVASSVSGPLQPFTSPLRTRKMSSMYNRLGGECSPYLLQHAENPVHWFPWGEEAFEAARKANKVIFLSVGYSTCHWCHVMEKESFENQDIANILNEKFISIKVDREERPDVDKIYMSFVQATTGGGGWPMSVFLTPGLKPIFGGTYFPPEDMMFGRPGFKTILLNIAKQWQDRNHELLESGDKILQALQSTIQAPSSGDAAAIDSRKVIDHCFSQLSRYYDTRMGGFSKAPKFPQCVNFNFLLDLYGAERQRNKEMAEQALEMCLHTLDCMSKGGIYDHVSLGFARYSTDATWHVPHFEKMLYDQAQLVVAYSQAFLASDQQHYAHIVRQVLTYVTRDLMHPMGAFFSGEDADSLPSHEDSTKKEGAFCVWTFKQIKSLLKKEQLPVGDSGLTCFDLFAAYFNVQPEGNVSAQQDPHGELTGKNVLTYIGTDIQALQERFKIDAQQMDQILSRCKDILYQERIKRPRPHLDDKILTSWNGLMITALCSAGSALQDQSYIDTAIRTASFIRQHLYDADKKMLLRSVYNDKEGQGIKHLAQPIPGFLDDYAMLIQALLDLYSVCFDSSWMSWAWELQEKQLELFWDTTDQGFFTASCDDESLVMRLKDDQDGSEPAANSVAARNLIRLSAYLDKPQYKDKAMEIFQCFHSTLSKAPIALPEMVRAVMLSHHTPRTIIISGDPSSCSVTRDMIKAVQTAFIPDAVVILADGKQDSIFYENLQVLKDISKWQGKAFVCHNFACSAPVNTAEELLNLIRN